MQNPNQGNGSGSNRRPIDLSDFKLPSNSGRFVKWLVIAVLGILTMVGLTWLRGVYTNWLWFSELGFEEVYTKILITKIWLFLVSVGAFLIVVTPNIWLVFRKTSDYVPPNLTKEAYGFIRKILGWVSALAVAFACLVFGADSASRWETVLRFSNSTPFVDNDGMVLFDPILNKGVDFYVFTLPFISFVKGWFLGATIVTLLFVVALYVVLLGLRDKDIVVPKAVKIHLTLIGAFLFLVIAAGYWIGRYDLLYSTDGVVFGVGFTDANARLPVKSILMVISIISAVLITVAGFMNGYRMIVGSVALWLGMAVLAGGIFPGLVQRFQVEPNELAKETTYLENNIRLTRQAYAIDLKPEQIRDHKGLERITPEIIENNRGTIDNIRLWDEGPLAEIYNQVEFVQFYYDFQSIGVDRYKIGDSIRQVMLSTRELSAEKLPEEAQTWVNRHLVYTHGHGVAMSPVNTVSSKGQPEMFIQNVPASVSLEASDTLRLDVAGIYYGLKSLPFVIVGSNAKELDYQGEGDEPQFVEYAGSGGVALSSFIRRLVYAWEFGDINILISGEVDTNKSRIQYRRTIPERFATVTPFISPDSDPYQVVADGRVFFIQDGYTWTSKFPYSTPWANNDFNYIRNSVKAVVDSYNGTLTYYVYDSEDPIIQSYSKIFPNLFKDEKEMPDYLKEHVRYPRDLFAIQSKMLLQYHMENVSTFYQKGDQWSIPVQSSFGKEVQMDPYYILARLPGEEKEEFLLIQPFTPDKRDPLKAWLAVRNDAPNYGELVLYRFPGGKSILGPNQVEARIDNNTAISQQFTLWGQVGSEVQRGNMLVIPVGDSILYAEPIFLKPESLDFPELRRIILADGERVVMQATLADAVRALKGEIPSVSLTLGQEERFFPPVVADTLGIGSITPDGDLELTQAELEDFLNLLKELGLKIEEIESILESIKQE